MASILHSLTIEWSCGVLLFHPGNFELCTTKFFCVVDVKLYPVPADMEKLAAGSIGE